jgi:hypothetical protein
MFLGGVTLGRPIEAVGYSRYAATLQMTGRDDLHV